MTTICAGELRHTVNIQTKQENVNSHGGVQETWSTLETVFAKIETLRGKELWTAQQVSPESTHLVTIRNRTDFDNSARITVDTAPWNGSTFHIDHISQDGDRVWTKILCKEPA